MAVFLLVETGSEAHAPQHSMWSVVKYRKHTLVFHSSFEARVLPLFLCHTRHSDLNLFVFESSKDFSAMHACSIYRHFNLKSYVSP